MYESILITGGAGFIASHVVDAFADAVVSGSLCARKIIVLDILDTCASKNNLQSALLHPFVEFVHGDIRDQKSVLSLFQEHNIEAVVHLAALSHVDNSFGNSIAFTDTNVTGTHVLLETAMQVWAASNKEMQSFLFLHISTDEVYGSCEKTAHQEHLSLLQPTNPYSATKAAAEMLAGAYRCSYKLPVVISRLNNVYGPRQYPEKVIPKFILRLKHGLLPRLQGSGKQKRTFLYCTDAARALLMLFQNADVGQVYNVGTNDEISVVDLATKLTTALAPQRLAQGASFDCDEDRPFNDQRYYIDASRIEKEIGWTKKVSFEEGLQKTIDWYVSDNISSHWAILPPDLFNE